MSQLVSLVFNGVKNTKKKPRIQVISTSRTTTQCYLSTKKKSYPFGHFFLQIKAVIIFFAAVARNHLSYVFHF
jgi:hypothetical protein